MKNKYNIQDSSRVFLWALFLPYVVSFLIVLLFSMFYTQDQLKTLNVYIIISMLISQFSFVFIFIFYNKKNNINALETVGLKNRVNWVNILLCVLISCVAVFGFFNFIGIFESILIKLGFSPEVPSLPLSSPLWLIINILISAVVPAIMEELIFRGIIFNGLKKRGFWFACLISSVFFMIVHTSIWSIIYPIMMGIVFCFVFEKTGSVLYTMIVHFCNNLLVIIIEYSSVKTGVSWLSLNLGTSLGIILAILFALVAGALLFAIVKYGLKAKQKEEKVDEIKEVECGTESEMLLERKKDNVAVFSSLTIGAVFWILILILTGF